jgi:hypothetical protein
MATMTAITPPRMTTTVPLSTAICKLGTFITGTIHRNIKYLQQAFRNRFQNGKKKDFRKGPVLALAMQEKKSQRFSFDTVYTQQSRRQTNSCQTRSAKIITKPPTIQVYNDFMRNTDTSDVMLIMTDHVDGVRHLRTAATNGPIEHGEPW